MRFRDTANSELCAAPNLEKVGYQAHPHRLYCYVRRTEWLTKSGACTPDIGRGLVLCSGAPIFFFFWCYTRGGFGGLKGRVDNVPENSLKSVEHIIRNTGPTVLRLAEINFDFIIGRKQN